MNCYTSPYRLDYILNGIPFPPVSNVNRLRCTLLHSI
nr:MAG TPA: hypothetical protein [Caudoviricetes sp.]